MPEHRRLWKLRPWDHQAEGFKRVSRADGKLLLGMDMGSGKSAIVCWYTADLHRMALGTPGRAERADNVKVLIVAPLSVVNVWAKQYRLHCNVDVDVVALSKGSVKKRAEQAEAALAVRRSRPVVIVINHEAAWRPPFNRLAMSTKWDLLVVDECHRAKSPGGKFSRFLHTLSKRVPRRVGLTGTPMPATPWDIYAQGRFIDDNIFGTSAAIFRAMYPIVDTTEVEVRENEILVRCPFKDKERFEMIPGHRWIGKEKAHRWPIGRAQVFLASMVRTAAIYSENAAAIFEALGLTALWYNVPKINLEATNAAFAAKLGELMYRVRTEDVLDLPDKQHVSRSFELLPKERRLYKELDKELCALVESGVVTAANAMVKSIRLRQVVSGFTKTEDDIIEYTGDGRRKLLKDILEDLNEPVAVFCVFKEDLLSIRTAAEKLGRSYGEISGSSKDGLTEDSTMADVDIVGVQLQSGGIGIDLTRARVGIYYSPTWSLGDYEQSLRRIDRPGQEKKMLFISLVAEDTVDETVYRALRDKKSAVEAVLGRVK